MERGWVSAAAQADVLRLLWRSFVWPNSCSPGVLGSARASRFLSGGSWGSASPGFLAE